MQSPRKNARSGLARQFPGALFVYGTLRKDCPGSTFPMIAEGARLVDSGRIQGRLYQLEDSPGLVLTQDPSVWVYGELYAFDDIERTLRRVDEYEGCGPHDPRPHLFRRVESRVALRSGRWERTWVYEFTGSTENLELIDSGDYVRYLRSK